MDACEKYPIRPRINGQDRAFDVEASVTLLDLLRERSRLTGTNKGCDHGQCGACTVLLDGRRVNARRVRRAGHPAMNSSAGAWRRSNG